MRFAVISNVYANLSALEAVLAAIDGDAEPIGRIVCAGDLVGLGPHPNEVLDLLQARKIEAVRGNYDDAVAMDRSESGVDFADATAEQVDREAIAWTRRSLTERNLHYLQSLPADLRIFPAPAGVGVQRDEMERRRKVDSRGFLARALFGGLVNVNRPVSGKSVLVVHGSTRALTELVRPDTARSILTTLSREAGVDVLITGHAGVAFQRALGTVDFVGAGSVSGPQAVPGQAEYAVVTTSRDQVEVDFGAASYDPTAHLRAVVESGLPPQLAETFTQSP